MTSMTVEPARFGHPAWRRPVLWESLALTAVCTADMVSTLYLVRAHLAVESNALLSGSLSHSDASFLLLKGASYVVPIAILELLRTLRPDVVLRALRACLAGYIALYLLGTLGLLLTR